MPRPRHIPAATWLVLPAFSVLLVFFVVPAASLAWRSFGGDPFTLAHYERLADELYVGILWRTIKLGIVSTLFAVLLGFPIAYAMSRARASVRTVLLLAVVAPLMMDVVIRTYGWVILLGGGGVINSVLLDVGLVASPLTLMFNETGMIIGLLNVFLPFMILPVYSSLRTARDRPYEEAAAVHGAGAIQVFWRVTLPLSVPGIAAGSVLVFVLAISAYATPALLGGSGNLVMTTLIGQQILAILDWQFGAALAVTLAVVVLTVISLYSAVLRRRFSFFWRVAAS